MAQKHTVTFRTETPRKLDDDLVESLRVEFARDFTEKLAQITGEAAPDTLDSGSVTWKQETK